MKQRTRKLLTLLLIAAMVMSLMVPALAADTAQSETPLHLRRRRLHLRQDLAPEQRARPAGRPG